MPGGIYRTRWPFKIALPGRLLRASTSNPPPGGSARPGLVTGRPPDYSRPLQASFEGRFSFPPACREDPAERDRRVVFTRLLTAERLAEIDALLNYLSNYAYPFERVGKNSWKWGVGRPAAAWRWEP